MSAVVAPSRRALLPSSVLRRAGWALTGVAALWAAVAVHGWTWWMLAVFLLPDLPLFAGGGRDLERGQLHPRAVPWYNATHHPVLAGVALAVSWAPLMSGVTAPAMVALVWTAHIGLDRAMGYGLRASDGHQRSRSGV